MHIKSNIKDVITSVKKNQHRKIKNLKHHKKHEKLTKLLKSGRSAPVMEINGIGQADFVTFRFTGNEESPRKFTTTRLNRHELFLSISKGSNKPIVDVQDVPFSTIFPEHPMAVKMYKASRPTSPYENLPSKIGSSQLPTKKYMMHVVSVRSVISVIIVCDVRDVCDEIVCDVYDVRDVRDVCDVRDVYDVCAVRDVCDVCEVCDVCDDCDV